MRIIPFTKDIDLRKLERMNTVDIEKMNKDADALLDKSFIKHSKMYAIDMVYLLNPKEDRPLLTTMVWKYFKDYPEDKQGFVILTEYDEYSYKVDVMKN